MAVNDGRMVNEEIAEKSLDAEFAKMRQFVNALSIVTSIRIDEFPHAAMLMVMDGRSHLSDGEDQLTEEEAHRLFYWMASIHTNISLLRLTLVGAISPSQKSDDEEVKFQPGSRDPNRKGNASGTSKERHSGGIGKEDQRDGS